MLDEYVNITQCNMMMCHNMIMLMKCKGIILTWYNYANEMQQICN